MANDPRTFLVKPCGKSRSATVGQDTTRKDFFNSLGKVGDIELLNNSATAGKVGQGLRALAATSNSIRIGENPQSAIPKNGTEVLAETGISQQESTQVSNFNPGVVNKAVAQADVIADKVKSGEFELSDIPGAFTDIQNLSTLVDGIFTGGPTDSRSLEICEASPFATDLIAFAPKYKFLFVMQFEFTEPFAASMKAKEMAFVIKNCTRPQINFEHEEVNMYNYWVRVPKRTSYEPMTMRFYDDNQNMAMTLFTAYLKAVSPIANMSFDQKMEDTNWAFEKESMGFENASVAVSGGNDAFFGPVAYASSFGPVGGPSNKNMFKRITMFQIYDYGRYMNEYRFMNPKILSMELDEMDMADNGNGNEVSMQFAYDVVHIKNTIPLSTQKNANAIEELTRVGTYPLKLNSNGTQPSNTSPTSEDEESASGTIAGSIGGVIGTVAGGITGVTSAALDFGTGLVSDAFQAVSDFSGSIFSSAAAAATSTENAIKGNKEPKK